MNDFKHPFIVCRHPLKAKNLEQFAKELALKLNFKVTAEFHDRFKITYENPKSEGFVSIIERKSCLIPQIKYELRFADFKIICYEDYFEIVVYFDIDYFHLRDIHTKNQLKDVAVFVEIFHFLLVMGISEIHVGILEEFGKGKKIKYMWRNVYKELSNTSQTFKVQF